MFDCAGRLKTLRKQLRDRRVDSFLVTSTANVRYLSGFTGDDSLILLTPDSQFFLTDSRYTEEAKATITGFNIIEVRSSTYEAIGNIVKKNRVKKMGFESMNLPFEVAKRLEASSAPAKLVPVSGAVETLRAIKDKKEVDCIKKAIRVNKDVLGKAAKAIRPGVSEKSLSAFIECSFLKKGAGISFPTIVACGKNSSKPHAHPGNAKIAKNDFVMVDMGCNFDNYNSDITRMFLIGRIKDKIKEIYGIVSAAQKKAIDAVRPGRKIAQVDSAGRDYIDKKGYGKFFGHSMGHGVGMDVHEEPSVSRRSTGILMPGMVFTVEPAIYIPGLGGVRIEDMVLVTDKGCEILTR